MQLLKQNSAEDYVLRGFSREEILEWTGIDVGYHGNALKLKLKGIDRFTYKVLYVQTYMSKQQILDVLEQYACGLDKESVLRSLGIAGANIVKLKKLFMELGVLDVFLDVDKRQRKYHMRDGMLEKFGTDNPFKLTEFQDKAADTRASKYGGRYTLSIDSSLAETARATYVEHMSDENFRQDVVDKRKATNLERYGDECAMNVAEVQEKYRVTCMEHYGVDHVSKTQERRDAMRQFMMKHGDEVREKGRQLCLEQCGVENYSQTEEARQRQSAYMLEHMDDVQEKMQRTMLERYGVRYSHQIPAVKKQMSIFMREHRDEILRKSQETCMERYGVPHSSQTLEFRQRMSERMSDKSVQQSLCRVKLKNHTFHTSSSEDVLYDMLVQTFGEDDVLRQYMSDVYPYQCDFYIKSRDMYVELNAGWTHGGHWYRSGTQDDNIVAVWTKKSTPYYDNAMLNWTKRDVQKRQLAASSKLNYVVFWDDKLGDVLLWFGMGCPDGQDYVNEYSWLPKRTLSCHFKYPNVLKNTEKCVIAAVKASNGSVFYKNELQLWQENPMMPRWGTLQARLYVNRYQYLQKLPMELSDADLLRGFSISGLYRGYSVFDNTGMNVFVKKYEVKSMYDPCAGWGERLLTASLNGVSYVGCDINTDLQVGHQSLIDKYGLCDVRMIYDDSSIVDMREHTHDCVFTCPPYEDLEVYTEIGAENLVHDVFLQWWKDVIVHSVSDTTKVFAYQINTRYKDDMNKVLTDFGWVLQEQIPVGQTKLSHMHHHNGNTKRKSWDEIQIFTR